jgi:hypothetical protein
MEIEMERKMKMKMKWPLAGCCIFRKMRAVVSISLHVMLSAIAIG